MGSEIERNAEGIEVGKGLLGSNSLPNKQKPSYPNLLEAIGALIQSARFRITQTFPIRQAVPAESSHDKKSTSQAVELKTIEKRQSVVAKSEFDGY